MDKYAELRTHGTNGINCDLDTDAINAILQDWDVKYGIDLSDVGHDRVNVQFRTLPVDLDALAQEIYDVCPDIIEQHFGCFAEMIAHEEDMQHPIPPEVRALVEGVDFSDEDYGLELLKRFLRRKDILPLW